MGGGGVAEGGNQKGKVNASAKPEKETGSTSARKVMLYKRDSQQTKKKRGEGRKHQSPGKTWQGTFPSPGDKGELDRQRRIEKGASLPKTSWGRPFPNAKGSPEKGEREKRVGKRAREQAFLKKKTNGVLSASWTNPLDRGARNQMGRSNQKEQDKSVTRKASSNQNQKEKKNGREVTTHEEELDRS